MLAPGIVLQNRYRIVRQLGQGGMGTVYEAVDERLDAAVALKETLFADDVLRKQFEREARLLARLHHPALPKVSDHFVEGGGQFLVMQFVEGEDLEALRKLRGGRFPQADVLRWADQLLDALDYLHTREPPVVHRDIKPQNLKLTARGQIILLDFGLAKGYAQATGTNATLINSFFGFTRAYAPLEQMQGLGTDPRSDLYSLAATLYHLLTGATPPDALSRVTATTDGDDDPLLPAHQLTTQVSPLVSAVLSKAMSRPRAQRFSSAAEMREALSQASAVGADNPSTLETTVIDLPPAERKTATGQRGRWDEYSFFGEAGNNLNPRQLDSLRRLYHFSIEHARVDWGTGTKTGSFSAKFSHVHNRSLYTVNTDGSLVLNFPWLKDTRQGREAAERFGLQLTGLRGFNIPMDFLEKYVTVPPDRWTGQVNEFIEVVMAVTRTDGSSRAGMVDEDEQTVVPRRSRRQRREARLLRFWEGLLAVGRGRTALHGRLSKPSERSYIIATAGIGGLAYGYNVFKHTSRVELYLSRRPASVNKRMFDELLSHKDEIEAAFGDSLSWQRLDERAASRVAYVLAGGHEDDEANWHAIQARMVDAMVRLEGALSPFIPTLMQMK